MEEIIDKLDFINYKLLLCKRSCQENKKTSHLEKIFAKDTSDKGLLSKIYKLKTQQLAKKNPVKKWAKDR